MKTGKVSSMTLAVYYTSNKQPRYLYITGRSKEIINKGGEVVSPFEVEEAIVTTAKDYVKVRFLAVSSSVPYILFSLPWLFPSNMMFYKKRLVLLSYPRRNASVLACSNYTIYCGKRQFAVRLRLLIATRGHLHPSKWPFAIVYMEDIPKNRY